MSPPLPVLPPVAVLSDPPVPVAGVPSTALRIGDRPSGSGRRMSGAAGSSWDHGVGGRGTSNQAAGQHERQSYGIGSRHRVLLERILRVVGPSRSDHGCAYASGSSSRRAMRGYRSLSGGTVCPRLSELLPGTTRRGRYEADRNQPGENSTAWCSWPGSAPRAARRIGRPRWRRRAARSIDTAASSAAAGSRATRP